MTTLFSMPSVRVLSLCLALFVMLGARPASAETKVWTGGGGNLSWHTAANWEPVGVPGPPDDVVIDVAGPAITVTFNTGTTTIASLQCAENLTVAGGTLNVDGSSQLDGTLTISGGTLGGSGPVTVTGALNWTTGTMGGSGTTTLAATSTSTLSGTSAKNLSRTLVNQGTLTWTGTSTGRIDFYGGTLVNEGEFIAAAAVNARGVSGTNAFVNEGLFRKTGTGTINFINSGANLPFTNDGTVQVEGGTLGLNSGTVVHSGPFTVAASTTLSLGATHTLLAGATISGAGDLAVTGGATAESAIAPAGVWIGGTINTSVDQEWSNLTISGGTLGGDGPVTVTGALNWTTGTMGGSGTTTLAATSTSTLSGTSAKNLSRTLVNQGTLTWTGTSTGRIDFYGGTLVNEGEFIAAAAVNARGVSGTNAFVNEGLFRKTGTGTINFINSGANLPFTNDGTVQVEGGTLGLNSGTVVHSGPFMVAASTTLSLGATHTLLAGATISGAGNLFGGDTGTRTFNAPVAIGGNATLSGTNNFTATTLSVGGTLTVTAGTTTTAHDFTLTNLTISGGTLGGSGPVTVTGGLNWTTGTMGGSGTTTLAATSTSTLSGTSAKNLSRTLVNQGTLTWTGTSTGRIDFYGGTLVNEGEFIAAAAVNARGVSGTNAFVNEGLFRKTGTGTINFINSGANLPFTNDGTVQVEGGTLGLANIVTNLSGTTLTGGTWGLAPSTTLNFPGSATVRTLSGGAVVTLSGSGSNFAAVNGLTTIQPGASFLLGSGRDFSATPLGGTFANSGSLGLDVGSEIAINGAYSQLATGSLAKTFGAWEDPVPLVASGDVALDGSLATTFGLGFTPTPEASMTLLTSGGTLAGTFATVSPSECTIALIYDPVSVQFGLDTVAPTALCQDITIQLDIDGNATIAAWQVDGGSSDNCEVASLAVEPSAFTLDDVGLNVVTLTVTDLAGNTATCDAVVTVVAGTTYPDLIIASVVIPRSSVVESRFTVEWTATNVGDGVANAPWVDRVYAATSPGVDLESPSAIVLGEVVGTSSLEPGASVARSISVTAPGEPGSYHIFVKADADNQIFEFLEGAEAEGNNITAASQPIVIEQVSRPDLIVSSVTPPPNASPGSVVSVAWVVTNIGTAATSGSWSETLSASLDDQVGNDIPGATFVYRGVIEPGESVLRVEEFQVPAVPPGGYWLVVCVDTGGQLVELDETNNCAIEPVCIDCLFPNLVVLSASGPRSGTASPVDPMTVTWTVENAGKGAASGSWVDSVSLVPEAGGAALSLAQFAVAGPLGSGDAYVRQETVAIPLGTPEGMYRLRIVTDAVNNVSEPGGEDDNVFITETLIAISGVPAPDLVVQSMVAPTSALFGDEVEVTWMVGNAGSLAATGVWQDRVYLSPTPGLGAGAVQLFAQTIVGESPLAIGATYSRSALVTIPLAQSSVPGVRYLIAQTDALDQVAELNEGNNVQASRAVEMSLPPLPNIVVTAVQTPPGGEVGTPITVGWTVTNIGTAAAVGPWAEKVYASTDSQVGGDMLVATRVFEGTLAPGASVARTADVFLPNISGDQFWLVVCSNTSGSVIELNPSDNCAASTSPGVIWRPDLVVSNVTAPTSAVGDASITVSWTLKNEGLAVAYPIWIEGVFIDAVDAKGVPVGSPQLVGTTVATVPLAGGVQVPRSLAVTVPGTLPDGAYAIRVRTDITNVVVETGPAGNNEAYAAGLIEITQPDRPNLVISEIATPADGLVGQSLSVEYTVANVGPVVAGGAWTDRVWAVNESTGQQVEVGNTVLTGPVEPLGSYTKSVVSSHPLMPGTYRIKVEVDRTNALNEGLDGGEDDNIALADSTFVSDTYVVTVSTPLQTGVPPVTVPLSGTATLASTGKPVADAAVSVAVNVQGTTRLISAATDGQGNYAASFAPLPTEAGIYALTAGPPGNVAPAVQDSFVLYGMRTQPASRNVTVYPKIQSATGSISLLNNGNVALTGIVGEITSEGAPRGLDVEIDLSSNVLPSLGVIQVGYTVSATGEDFGVYPVQLALSSAEGATAVTTLNVSIQPPAAQLVAQPGSVSGSMVVPESSRAMTQSIVEFQVKNIGAGAATGVNVLLPAAPWMALGVPASLGTIEPGETRSIVLVLSPGVGQPLGPYTGSLAVSGSNTSVSVPFTIDAISSAIGNLRVKATDEFTYWDAENDFPAVPGATIAVRNAFNNQVVATGVTESNGQVVFPALTSGYYKLKATESTHGAAEVSIFLPGTAEASFHDVEVFMPASVVSYEWTVVPTQIQDEYTITIETIFQTNVPVPVITIEPALIDLEAMQGPVMQVDLVVTNHGLIAANAFELIVADHPRYKITPLATGFGDLAAQSSLVIPVVFEDMAFGSEGGPAAGPICAAVGFWALWELFCGEWQIYSKPITCKVPGCPPTITDPPPPCYHCFERPKGGGSDGGYVWYFPPLSFNFPSFCDSCLVNCVVRIATCVKGSCEVNTGKCIVDGIVAVASGSLRGVWKAAVRCGGTRINCIVSEAFKLTKKFACVCRVTRECLLGCPGNCPCTVGDVITLVLGGSETPCFGGDGDSGGIAGVLPAIETLLGTINGTIAQVLPVAYVLGDAEWFVIDESEEELLAQLLLDFDEFTEEASEEGERLSASEQALLLESLPSHLTPAHLDSLVSRWHRSLDYWEMGITHPDQLPEGWDPDFAAADVLEMFVTAALLAELSAEAAGFEDLNDAWEAHQFAALADIGEDSGAICAQVTIQISQNVVIARDAFEATLKLKNNGEELPLESILVAIDIRDAFGLPAQHLFEVLGPTLTNLGAVDGSGSLPAGQEGVATWIIVPTHDAAPGEPTDYFVSGTLAYALEGAVSDVPLLPVSIQVHPNANLDLKYFIEKLVLSDDPFTEEVEPAVPFALGLQIVNKGAGPANDLKISTAQPQIVQNDLGLLIDFQIITALLDGREIPPSLQLNFGNVAPFSSTGALWLMTSSLQGEFVSYSATFENLNGLGAPGVSLIDTVEIFPTLRPVRADVPSDDGLFDYLTLNQFMTFPDALHLSDGTVEPATTVFGAVASGPATPLEPTVDVTVALPEGWVYFRVPDPSNGAMVVTSVVRSDGRSVLVGPNAWQTRAILNPSQNVQPAYLHLFDRLPIGGEPGLYTYTVSFEDPKTEPPPPPPPPPAVASWSLVALHGNGVGEAAIPLSPSGTAVEPRSSGIRTLRLAFSEPVSAAAWSAGGVQVSGRDASNKVVPLGGVAISTALLDEGAVAEITFTPALPDKASYCIRILGVADSFGQALGGATSIVVSSLRGDVGGDLLVDFADLGEVLGLLGTDPIDPSNLQQVRGDLDMDGAITYADVQIVFSGSGITLAGVSDPCSPPPSAVDPSLGTEVSIPGVASDTDAPGAGAGADADPGPGSPDAGTAVVAASVAGGDGRAAASSSDVGSSPLSSELSRAIVPIELLLGETYQGALAQEGTLFTIRVDREQTLHVALDHDSASSWSALELHRGEVIEGELRTAGSSARSAASILDSSTALLAAAALPASASQRLEIPHLERGVYTLVATARARSGEPNLARVRAEARPFEVTGVAREVLGRDEATVVVHGSRLFELGGVALRSADRLRTIASKRVRLAADGTAEVTFDLATGSTGDPLADRGAGRPVVQEPLADRFDVVAVSRSGVESLLRGAVVVVESTGPQIRTRLELPASMAAGTTATARVVVENVGNVDAVDHEVSLGLPTAPDVEVLLRSGLEGVVIVAGGVPGEAKIRLDRLPAGATREIDVVIALAPSFRGDRIVLMVGGVDVESTGLSPLGLGRASVIPVVASATPQSRPVAIATHGSSALVAGGAGERAVASGVVRPYRVSASQPRAEGGHAGEVQLRIAMGAGADLSTLRLTSLAVGGAPMALRHEGWRQGMEFVPASAPRALVRVRTQIDPESGDLIVLAAAFDAASGEAYTDLWPDLPAQARSPLAELELSFAVAVRADVTLEATATWTGRGDGGDPAREALSLKVVAGGASVSIIDRSDAAADPLIGVRMRLADASVPPVGARLVIAVDRQPAVAQPWTALMGQTGQTGHMVHGEEDLFHVGEAGRSYAIWVDSVDASGLVTLHDPAGAVGRTDEVLGARDARGTRDATAALDARAARGAGAVSAAPEPLRVIVPGVRVVDAAGRTAAATSGRGVILAGAAEPGSRVLVEIVGPGGAVVHSAQVVADRIGLFRHRVPSELRLAPGEHEVRLITEGRRHAAPLRIVASAAVRPPTWRPMSWLLRSTIGIETSTFDHLRWPTSGRRALLPRWWPEGPSQDRVSMAPEHVPPDGIATAWNARPEGPLQ